MVSNGSLRLWFTDGFPTNLFSVAVRSSGPSGSGSASFLSSPSFGNSGTCGAFRLLTAVPGVFGFEVPPSSFFGVPHGHVSVGEGVPGFFFGRTHSYDLCPFPQQFQQRSFTLGLIDACANVHSPPFKHPSSES